MTAATAVLLNALYEYRKGVRQLFLLTLPAAEIAEARRRLSGSDIDRFEQQVSPTKVNLFFGHPAWVETARRIADKPLPLLSPEEDFILGTLLGYDREQQCRRFLGRTARRDSIALAAE